MPDEQVGFGPAALENPEASSFATKAESLIENPIPESAPEQSSEKAVAGKYEKLLSHVTTSTATQSTDDQKVDLERIQALEGEEEKIEHLVKIAETKGLAHAVQVADRLKDYYALDMFHDEIVNNLYETLVQRGLITRE